MSVPAMFFGLSEAYSFTNPYVELNVDALGIDTTGFAQLLRFKTETYVKLGKSDPDENALSTDLYGMATLRPVNHFFETLSIDDQRDLAMFFVAAHLEIERLQEITDSEDILDTIGTDLDRVDQNIDLCGKLDAFVRAYIPVNVDPNAGGRAQDTEEMTFKLEEATVLTTIVMLSKVMFPLMGAYISKCRKKENPELRLLHCYTMYTKLFSRRFEAMFAKLDNYIERLIKEHATDATAVINGLTRTRGTLCILATIVTKSFVNANLYAKDSNLLRYIVTCARSSIGTKYRTAAKRDHAQFRRDPSEMDSGKEDGNTSRLENESVQSVGTADTPIFINMMAQDLFRKLIVTNQLTTEEIEALHACLAYYEMYPIRATPINTYLLCTFFGRQLAGARSIMYMNAKNYSQLVTLLQFILLKAGNPELMHALTLQTGSMVKTELTFEDARLHANWRSCHEYLKCSQSIKRGFGEKDWHTKLTEIAEFAIANYLYYSTAPELWRLLGQEPKTSVYEHTEKMLQSICDLIYNFFQEQVS